VSLLVPDCTGPFCTDQLPNSTEPDRNWSETRQVPPVLVQLRNERNRFRREKVKRTDEMFLSVLFGFFFKEKERERERERVRVKEEDSVWCSVFTEVYGFCELLSLSVSLSLSLTSAIVAVDVV
jgi:hypothetical protein